MTTLFFDGKTYDTARDGERLSTLFQHVRDIMLDGRWHTIGELAHRTGGSETSVSARIRDLRKQRFGAFEIERDYRGHGIWAYRVAR